MTEGERQNRERGLRIFVVEDEALVALILEDMLMDLGHEILGPVYTASEGLEMSERNEIDLAILDLNLKGVSSLPIANSLRARGIPVVFSTGFGRGGLPEPFRDAPFLQKPYQQSDINEVIKQATKVNGR